MWWKVTAGVLIPFLGTALGSACVFFFKNGEMNDKLKKALGGFAAGVMASASFFSLLLPSIEQSRDKGALSFLPAAIGFACGMLFFLILDLAVPHMHLDHKEEGVKSGLKRTTKLLLAVTLHNLPEGMAVGIVFVGWLYGNDDVSLMSALALSVGIALQNFPEGAIVSLPLRAEGMKKGRTFLCGVLSGVVEPIGALLMIFAARFFLPVLPYLLAFAAGAMFYVIVEELIPETAEGKHTNVSTLCFALGFVLMMAMDIGLA